MQAKDVQQQDGHLRTSNQVKRISVSLTYSYRNDTFGLDAAVAADAAALDGSTVRDDIVGLDLLIGLFAVEHLREELLDLGNPSAAFSEMQPSVQLILDVSVSEEMRALIFLLSRK
jgi:hypothetical protein